MAELASGLRGAVAQTPLAARFERFAEPFLQRRGGDASLRALPERAQRALARLLASHPDCGRYLSHRPALVERIATGSRQTLLARMEELERSALPVRSGDLEESLDALRIFRRDETCFCAALDLGGEVSFELASAYLSRIAGTCVRWALAEAEARVRGAATTQLGVVGMGKISGRELTYYSDLDLVFLYADDGAPHSAPATVAQRTIFYLETMTSAGAGYAVDARLRPSGRQGALVSVHSAFESYQLEKAALWEHVALMRSRVLAGDPRSAEALERTRRAVLALHRSVWPQLADMRERIVLERARPMRGRVAYKTGRGGLMDVEFLAQGGALESGRAETRGQPPSIENLLRASVAGPQVDAILEQYRFLRLLEARARWVSGRATESFSPGDDAADCVAELVEPGTPLPDLLQRIETTCAAIRAAYQYVIERGSITALSGASPPPSR